MPRKPTEDEQEIGTEDVEEFDPDYTPREQPPRFTGTYTCGNEECGIAFNVTADQGAQEVKCFACGFTNHVFVGPAANLQTPATLSEETV